MTKSPLWYGVLPGGACGMFDPTQTKPYIPPEKNVCHVTGTLSPNPTRHSARSIRTSLLRSDVKRHTYTGKRTIQRSMISSPQGDVKHTGHVGLDGAYFGDISFLDPAGCPPRQVVTPYKPSEDLEQVPLINPNSPSHLTGASGTTPYPMLTSHKPNTRPDCDEIDLSCESRTRSLRRSSQRTISEPTTSKSILSKVRCATLGRSHKTDNGAVPKTDEIHEYHEISDTDTEPINNSTNYRSPSKRNPDIRKSTDFSESLLEEMEEMFRTLDQRNNDESGSSKLPEHPFRPHTMSRSERKKILASSTVKPMSAHDERTLNTAVALANEITSRSMTDLGTERKAPQSPNDRNKFVFKFPFPLHHGIMNDADKDKESTGRQERRNFSEEAKSVPDLQSTITEESKLAYTSLIEEPTPSTSMMAYSHASVEKSILKPGTSTKQPRSPTVAFTAQPTTSSEEPIDVETYACNVLPLPPRTNKPKLVDKPRHIRKYPLKLPSEAKTTQTELTGVHVIQPIIYQNTQADDQDVTSSVNQPTLMTGEVTRHPEDAFVGPTVVHVPYVLAVMSAQNLPQVVARVSVDETGTPPALANTNPFVGDDQIEKDDKPPMSAEEFFATTKARPPVAIIFEDSDEIIPFSSVTDDQVSVEDLLELNYRPCGRQSGLESDEVRIMCKVLKNEATAEDCLEALNVSDWDVHSAIKVARVKHAVGDKATFQECMDTLDQYNNDVITSITAIHVQDPSLT